MNKKSKYISINTDRYNEIFIRNKPYHWTDSAVKAAKQMGKNVSDNMRHLLKTLK